MKNADEDELKALDETLHSLLKTHSYSRVLVRLVQIAGEQYQQRLVTHSLALDPRYLMTLAPEEREPFVEASMVKAAPENESDKIALEVGRQQTANLETSER